MEAPLLLSIGTGLLVRQLRHVLFGQPEVACPNPSDFHIHAPVLLPAPIAPLTPTLRLPTSPGNVAAWASGALAAQVLVFLVRRIALLMRGGTTLRVRRVGNRIDLESFRRGGSFEC